MSGILEGLAISAAVSLATAGITYALTPTQKLDAGRISDLTSAKSSYGASLPLCWGNVRVGGNLIWSTYLDEVTKKNKQGKGAKVQTNEYSYYGSFAVMLADCPFRPLVDIPRIWANKKLVYSKVGGAETIAEGGKYAKQYLRFYKGEAAQEIDPLLQFVDPIQSYSYGLPRNKEERNNYLRSLGLDPNQTVFTPAYNGRAYLVATRLPLGDFFNSLPTVEAEVKASNNCTAGQIIKDIFGLFYPANRFDVSLISTPDFTCHGFFINSVEAAKNAVQNLQKAFFFDLVDSNGKFTFIPLNHPRTPINLNYQDLAAHQSGTKLPFDYEVSEADPNTLPSEVVVSYIDKDLNYDTNEQRSTAQVKKNYNPNVLNLSFAIVMSASQAATIADRTLFLSILLAKTYKFSLPPAYLYAEPADLIPNPEDDDQLLKISQTRIGANLILECEATPYDLSFWQYKRNIESGSVTVGVAAYSIPLPANGRVVAVSNSATQQIYTEGVDYDLDPNGNIQPTPGGAISTGTQVNITSETEVLQSDDEMAVIRSPGNTNLKVLDIPLIRDEDSDYTIYLTADGGKYWKGCNIYVSTDNSRYLYAGQLNTYGIFGTAQSLLGSYGNVTVSVNETELESITNNDLAIGLNIALIGDEIVQFRNAVLNGEKSYRLSGLVRGLRGTEAEIGNHAIGDRFILLTGENAVITRIIGTASDIGQLRYFKALSTGQTLDQVSPTQLTIQGLAQRPYSPVEVTASKDPAGNITINWTRRDRHAGNQVGAFESTLNMENPPLSEGLEQYELKIIGSNNIVARNITSPANTYNYEGSQQIADFGSIQTTITVKIAQISSVVGSGSFVTATLTPS